MHNNFSNLEKKSFLIRIIKNCPLLICLQPDFKLCEVWRRRETLAYSDRNRKIFWWQTIYNQGLRLRTTAGPEYVRAATAEELKLANIFKHSLNNRICFLLSNLNKHIKEWNLCLKLKFFHWSTFIPLLSSLTGNKCFIPS